MPVIPGPMRYLVGTVIADKGMWISDGDHRNRSLEWDAPFQLEGSFDRVVPIRSNVPHQSKSNGKYRCCAFHKSLPKVAAILASRTSATVSSLAGQSLRQAGIRAGIQRARSWVFGWTPTPYFESDNKLGNIDRCCLCFLRPIQTLHEGASPCGRFGTCREAVQTHV
jgi:hypothetical protein